METLRKASTLFIDKVSNICNIEFMKINDETQFEPTAKLFRILGHPMRLAIIEALHGQNYCVCELANQLGLNKSITSKHLSSLKSVGIIDMKREGTQVNCILTMPCILDMMHCVLHQINKEN